MAKGDVWTVTCDKLYVRIGPSFNADITGGLEKNDTIIEIESVQAESQLWIRHDTGWSSSTGYMKKIKKKVEVISSDEDSEESGEDEENRNYGYLPDPDILFSKTNTAVADSDFIKIRNVAGVFGLPYQFLPNTDIRLSGDKETENIGYEYGNKIIERIPLLFLAPGKANFMTRYSKKAKKSIVELLITSFTGTPSANIEDLLESDGRYYTFEYDQVRYYKFVNPMCRIAARYMNVQDVQIDGVRLDMIGWQNFTKSRIKSIGDFGYYSSIPFYVDTDTSISENFSNNTTQSMLTSTINQVSDLGRELNFLLGNKNKINSIDAIADPDISSSLEDLNNFIGEIFGSGHFLKSLTSHLVTVASGGRLVFPEIWSDSSFSRSYNCEIKLISPDPSPLSVYLNVIVPLLHLIGLVAPQSAMNNPNGYINPFIIRAIYKGFFNVDMGIITDMSVTKGAECQWTPEGVPTSIVVNISIKDLYSTMSITSTEQLDWRYDTMNNTALMDYIANLCGINIYKPEIARNIEMWIMNNTANRAQDLFTVDIWGGITQKVQNIIMGIFR